MSRGFKCTMAGVLIMAFWLITPLYFDLVRPRVLTTLAVGWLSFLRRNVPALAWHSGLMFTGLICSAGVVLLIQRLLGNWTTAAWSRAPGGNSLGCRSWRWALGIYAGLWVLFLLAFATGGLYWEVRWLSSVKEPWFERVENSTVELRIAAGMVEQVLLENQGDVRKARQALLLLDRPDQRRTPWLERFDIILEEAANGAPPSWVIIPRKGPRGRADRFCVDGDIQPIGQLTSTLARLDAVRAGSGAVQGATERSR